MALALDPQAGGASSLRVSVLLFASYAEAFGGPSVEVTLPAGSTVADLLGRVRDLAPVGAKLPPAPMVAINQSYALSTDRIQQGDEVAIIPPVAGG